MRVSPGASPALGGGEAAGSCFANAFPAALLPPSGTRTLRGDQINTKLSHLYDLCIAGEPVASIEYDDCAPSSQRAQGRDPVVRVVKGVHHSPRMLHGGWHAQLEVVVAEEADDGAGLAADPAARKDIPGQVGDMLWSGVGSISGGLGSSGGLEGSVWLGTRSAPWPQGGREAHLRRIEGPRARLIGSREVGKDLLRSRVADEEEVPAREGAAEEAR